MTKPDKKTTDNQALVDALVKFQQWCDAGGPDLVAELASLKAQLAEATETFTAPDGEVWNPPTAEAYYRACQALRERGRKLAEAEKERDEAERDAYALQQQWEAEEIGLKSQLTAATQEAEQWRKSWADLRSGLVDMEANDSVDLFGSPINAIECAIELMDSIATIEDSDAKFN